MKTTRLALSLCFLASLVLAADAQTTLKHIRVIVDTSASLHKTDPSGYVKLSTELFYDLALKELDPNDTFKVAHFPDKGDPSWPKVTTPPQTIGPCCIIVPGRDVRGAAEFRSKIRGLSYTSQWTYFSPGMQWALNDLEAAGSARDNRVVILITDGKPDPFVESEDKRRIAELAAKLRQDNIRVYILAFGKEAEKGWFDEAFGFGSASGVEGQVFAGADAGHLLSDMLEIFSQSFGFSRQTIAPGTTSLDIAGDTTLQRAAVVALYRGKPNRPEFRLDAPAGMSLGTSRISTEGAEHDRNFAQPWTDLSYAYQWLEPPQKGIYHLDSNGPPPDEIAILRPVRVRATIRSFQGISTDVVMAGKPAPMEVVVSPWDGPGDPGKNIRVRYYLKYLQPNDSELDAGKTYQADPPEGREAPGEGRVFLIHPEFIKNPAGKPEDTVYYPAYIDVEVTQYNTPIYRMGDHPHPVRVYPYVSVGVSPNPTVATTSGNKELIRGGQAGCVTGIQFVDNAASITAKSYTLAVRVINPNANAGAWRGAKFRFDGKDLSTTATDWQMDESETPPELEEAKHSFCVIAGTPTSQADKNELQVHFGLWRNGADTYEQQLSPVDDLIVKASIAAPGFWQVWTPWLILLLSALLAWLLLAFLRSRQGLAPDLGVTLEPVGGVPFAAPAGTRSLASSFLGISQERPVLSLAGDREIGRVQPAPNSLFVFRPEEGFRVVSVRTDEGWVPLAPEADGSLLLSAGVTYRTGLPGDIHHFRIDYSQQRPPI